MKHADVTAALVAAETDRVASTAASFRNDAVLAPSLCAGWSRGHVLAHLARNADALVRVCDVALTGTADTMYDDVDSRDADIERGARRSAHDHATDIRDTAARLAQRLEALRPEHADVRVERTPGGFPIRVGMVPFMRLREVVYHHVDLDGGYTFASAPPEVVSLFLRDAANRLAHDDTPPSLHVVTTEGDDHVVGDGATQVAGSAADVVLWLAR
ncbi:MAG: maleylpyruvate isomerase family mycothiol-dependent enzyme [Terrabacter sp.]|nr:maleylpyruvate isomerase family mycothiol-dependent enzyme [Terrabacter sp.]